VQALFGAKIHGGSLTNEVVGTTDEARWIPLLEVRDLPRVAIVDTALGLRQRWHG
jgi:8-oxo-dGTP diphosphatase